MKNRVVCPMCRRGAFDKDGNALGVNTGTCSLCHEHEDGALKEDAAAWRQNKKGAERTEKQVFESRKSAGEFKYGLSPE